MNAGLKPTLAVGMACWLAYMILMGWGPRGDADLVARLFFGAAVVLCGASQSDRKSFPRVDRDRLSHEDLRQLRFVDASGVLMVVLLLSVRGLCILGDPIMKASDLGRMLIRIAVGPFVLFNLVGFPVRAAYLKIVEKVRD